MGDAEDVLERLAPQVLEGLHKKARKLNLEASRGTAEERLDSSRNPLLGGLERAPTRRSGDIAREAISGFVERVEQSAEKDPRPRNRAGIRWSSIGIGSTPSSGKRSRRGHHLGGRCAAPRGVEGMELRAQALSGAPADVVRDGSQATLEVRKSKQT
jgi:hypothetical protein